MGVAGGEEEGEGCWGEAVASEQGAESKLKEMSSWPPLQV